MGKIYRQAHLVNVWLGPAAHDSDILIKACNTISIPATMRGIKGYQRATSNLIEALHSFGPSVNLALDASFRRSYWSRLWIIQEVILAKDIVVFCGTEKTPWQNLFLLFKIFSDLVDLLPNDTQRYRQMYRQTGGPDFWTEEERFEGLVAQLFDQLQYQQSMTLGGLLVKYNRPACTEIRDRVYGLLPLATDYSDGAQNFQVDYRSEVKSLFFYTMAHCDPLHSVELGSVLLDSLNLRSLLPEMRLDADSENNNVSGASTFETPNQAIIIQFIGNLTHQCQNSTHAMVGANPPPHDEALLCFEIRLLIKEIQSKGRVHFHEIALFLESKHCMTDSTARLGDRVYWISQTPHVFLYRKCRRGDSGLNRLRSEWARIGRGALVPRLGTSVSAALLKTPIGMPPKYVPRWERYSATLREVLFMLQEEPTFTEEELVTKERIVQGVEMRVPDHSTIYLRVSMMIKNGWLRWSTLSYALFGSRGT